MIKKMSLALAIAFGAYAAVPLVVGSAASAETKCSQVYTTSGWISRCR